MKLKKRTEPRIAAPWQDRLGEDCRPALKKLEAANWNPEVAYALFSRPLADVISSLHFNSHQRWGVQVDAEEIRHLSEEFLQWMNRAGRWEDWKSALEELPDAGPPETTVDRGPAEWPLRYFLARFFVRFQKDLPLRSDFLKDEPSFSSKRSLLDLSQASELSRQMTESTMSAFASLTQRLPQKTRLAYDLHLEGLLDAEIAWISGTTAEEVESLVREAKEFLLGLASGGTGRREGT
jgi:hypothetical protein